MKDIYIFTFELSDNNSVNLNKQIKANAISWKKTEDKQIHTSNSWYLNKQDLISVGLPTIKKETFTLQDKKIYRFPKLDLPRQKVDLLKEKFNCKVIRDPNKADVHVVSSKFFSNLFVRQYGLSVPVADMFKMLKTFKEKNNLFTDKALESINDFLAAVPKNAVVMYSCKTGWSRSINVDPVYSIIKDYENDFLNDRNNNWLLPEENCKSYNDIVFSTATIVLDTDICDIIDQDLAVLTSDQYNEIEQMVKNNDIDNRSLALEMLANCNINKSFDVVSGLYFWWYDHLKNTTNWQTANVKTFRKRMSSYEGNHDSHSVYSYNKYIKSLAEDDKLTVFALNKTKEKLHNVFLNKMVGPASDVFKVDLESIYINQNLTDQIIKDE